MTAMVYVPFSNLSIRDSAYLAAESRSQKRWNL
jgi:hypothetical protein